MSEREQEEVVSGVTNTKERQKDERRGITLCALYGETPTKQGSEKSLCVVKKFKTDMGTYGRLILHSMDMCGLRTSSWGGRWYRIVIITLTCFALGVQLSALSEAATAVKYWSIIIVWVLWQFSLILEQSIFLLLTWNDPYRYEKMILLLVTCPLLQEKVKKQLKRTFYTALIIGGFNAVTLAFGTFGPIESLQKLFRTPKLAQEYLWYRISFCLLAVVMSYTWIVVPGLVSAIPCKLVTGHLNMVVELTQSVAEGSEEYFSKIREAFCYVGKTHTRMTNQWMQWFLFGVLATYIPLTLFLIYTLVFVKQDQIIQFILLFWLMCSIVYVLAILIPPCISNSVREELLQYATSQELVERGQIKLMLLIEVLVNSTDVITLGGVINVTWNVLFKTFSAIASAFVILYKITGK
jgi:hypothetical protein